MSLTNNVHIMGQHHHSQPHVFQMGVLGSAPWDCAPTAPAPSYLATSGAYFAPLVTLLEGDSQIHFDHSIGHHAPHADIKNKNCQSSDKSPDCHTKTNFKNKVSLKKVEFLSDGDDSSKTPSHYMNLFLDDYLINLLVDGTNWYIEQVPRNRKERIVAISASEIRCVIAILYLSGYVDLPRVRMFWERAPDTSFPLVVDAIPRDRFETIFTHLHSAGSAAVDRKNPLSRIGTLVEDIKSKFLRNAPTDVVHSIDQLNIPYYKQATGLRQFTKTKSMKVWCGCTSSGYCVWFDHSDESAAESSSIDPRLAADKIFAYATKMSYFKLIDASLIYDNIFAGLRIGDELKELRIEGKPVPNRISLTVSKSHRSGVKRSPDRLKEQSKVHNSPMGGIDKLDQNINLYAITIIGKKWTFHFLLAYILDLCMHNAWQIYRGNNINSLDLLGFRRSIVTQYLTKFGKPTFSKSSTTRRSIKRINKNGKVTDLPVLKTHNYRYKEVRYDGIEHYVIPQVKQTRCFHCKMKTMTRCCKCDVGLHVKCFVDYHTRGATVVSSQNHSVTDVLQETKNNA